MLRPLWMVNRKTLNIEFRTDDLSKEERALAEALVDKYHAAWEIW